MQPQEPTPTTPAPTPEPPKPEVATQATPVTPAPADPTTTAAIPPATPKKGMPTVVKVILIVSAVVFVLLAVGGFALFKFAGNTFRDVDKVSNALVNSIQANDTNAAYALTTNAFQEATSQEDLNALIEDIAPTVQSNEKITGRKLETQNGVTRAAVVYSIPSDNGTQYIRVVLEKEGDNWKVLNFVNSKNSLTATIE